MSVQAMMDYTYVSKYARYNKDKKRRETWDEAIDRVKQMHLRKYPQVKEEIEWAFDKVLERRVLGSQRALQFGGVPIEKVNARIYNCISSYCDRLRFFQEAFYLLLCGCGTGFSVQKHHVAKLPQIHEPTEGSTVFQIPDSIEGWADALGVLLESYMSPESDYFSHTIEYDFSLIRKKGSSISSGSGKAPGPEPLKKTLECIQSLINNRLKVGAKRLRPIDAYDIVMHSADAVLSGGIRRCLAKGARVLTRLNGFKSIEDIVIGDEVSTPQGWKKVTNTFIQGIQGVVTIKHQDGELTCTPNHRVAVLKSTLGNFEWKVASDLVSGDRLFYTRTICDGFKNELPKWIYDKPINSTTCKNITIPNLDEELAWLIGVIQGDGYVFLRDDSGQVSVAVEGSNPHQANFVKEQLERFDVNAKIRLPREDDNCFKVIVKSKQLASYLYRYVKQPKKVLRIPDFIKSASPSIRFAFLQGILDSDGSVKTKPQQAIVTIYKEFAKDIQNLYYSLGISTRFKKLTEPKNDWQHKYSIVLINNCDKEKFSSNVGFKEYTSGKISREGNGFPMSFFEGEKPQKWHKKFCINNKQINLDSFQGFYGITKIVPIEVKEIQYRKKNIETYDIEVEDSHCFICEGVLVHNSATIALFSPDDMEMVKAKTGDWFYQNPQRARSNNSALLIRGKTTHEQFHTLIKYVKEFGEPGFVWADSEETLYNPSLRKGTLVLTSDGIFPIEKLEDKEFFVKNLYGEKSLAKCFLSGKNKKLYKITLVGGKSFYATAEHKWPIYNDKGRKYFTKKETIDLSVGDLLPTLTSHSLNFGDKGDYNDGFLVGYLYGDGWITERNDGHIQYGFIVSQEDVENGVFEKLNDALKVKIGSVNWSKRISESGKFCYETNFQRKSAFDYFSQFECDNSSYKKNGFHKFVWQESSEEFRKGLIDGLFTTDGTIADSYSKAIAFNSSKKKLAEDVADLLGFYGIKTGIGLTTIDGSKRVFPNGKKYDKIYKVYHVRINDGNSLSHFAELFNLSHKSKNDKIKKYFDGRVVPKNGTIKIKSIEETTLQEDVWDVTVYDKTHCFQLSQCMTGNCVEISLYGYDEFGNSGWEACNLCEINGQKLLSVEDFEIAAKAASIIGTLQAGYTSFPYLGEVTQRIIRKEALLGVSITGMMEHPEIAFDAELQRKMAELIKNVNFEIAKKIGINIAARCTCVKPSGCQNKETLIVTNQGILRLDEIGKTNGETWQNHKIEVLSEKKYKTSTSFFVNGFAKTKKIKLDSGLELESTFNHQYKVFRDNELKWVRADEIEIGDILPYIIGGYNSNQDVLLDSLNNADLHFNSNWKTSPKMMNADLCWLIGLYIGGGSNHKKGIRIHGNKKVRALRIFEEQFQLKGSFENLTENGLTLVINSVDLLHWLEINGLKKNKSSLIEIPLKIRMTNVEFIKSFIDGYWCADGCLHANKIRSWVTTSHLMAEQLVVVLRSIGQDCSLREMPPTSTSKGKRMRYWIQERKGRRGKINQSPNRNLYKKLDEAGLCHLTPDFVISIKDSDCDTFDIEVPDGNDYCANSYISHNTTSCVLGTSSGIHPHYSKLYFRRIQGNILEAPLAFFTGVNPHAVEQSVWSANKTDTVITFCVEVQTNALTRKEIGAIQFLEYVKLTQQNWVEAGTRLERCVQPWLRHNVSNTIQVKPEEWNEVEEYIYNNRQYFAGISLLPSTGDLDYPQAPFCSISTPKELVEKYGDGSIFASGLIVDGLHTFHDLWKACDAVVDRFKPQNDLQQDWVRRAKQFAQRYFDNDVQKMLYTLREVNNLKVWNDLKREWKDVDYSLMQEDSDNTNVAAEIACGNGQCEVNF